MKLKSKLFTSAVAFSMVLSMIAIPASAQTTAELTAQINSLLAMIAQLQAQIAGGGMTTTTTTTFTTDLTVGSTGSEVSALQQWLVGKGFLTMPAGVAYGYFGNLTKAAVAAYQASAGITPAVGYFGPITRSKVNVLSTTTTTTTTTTTVGCVAGATYSSVTGALCSSTTSGTITTPGVEGTISVTQNNSGVASTVYEGDSKIAILGFDVEAKTSDMAVQRIKLDLDEDDGSDTKFYNKIFNKLYVTEGGNVLASIDLNSSTVVKDGANYFITLTGFSLIVPKNTKKQIVIKADVYGSIDSADYDAENYTISLPAAGSGIRAVDGAGIDQYAGDNTITRTPIISATLSDSATLKLSLNTSSPKKNDVVAAAGAAENELDNLTVLVFDAKAEKDEVTITDLVVRVAKTGSGAATASTSVRIFDGSTELDSVSMAIGAATFADLDLVIPKDTTKTLTVKVDVRAANATIANFVTSVTAADSTDENSQGDSVTTTGTATGNSIGIRNAGPEITLLSRSITTTGTPQGSALATATSSLTASFSIQVKAVGADLLLGTNASSTPMFESDGSATNSFVVYKNGVAVTTLSNSTSTAYTIPSTCVAGASEDCTLAEGSEVTIPITYLIQGRVASVGTVADSGLYAIGLEKINWGNAQTTTFMSGETDWRTSDVSFP